MNVLDKLKLTESAGRYGAAAEVINQHQSPFVLEVGPAAKGIAPWLKETATVVYSDVMDDFGEGSDLKVKASAENLPFKTGGFDFVVSLDAIEHMPASIRLSAIAEMYRVTAPAGKTIISSPVGEDAEKADHWLAETLQRHGIDAHKWVAEHITYGIPSHSDYSGWFEALDPQPTDIRRQDDISVRAWQRALEVTAVPSNFMSRCISMARFARLQYSKTTEEPTYRTIFTLEKASEPVFPQVFAKL